MTARSPLLAATQLRCGPALALQAQVRSVHAVHLAANALIWCDAYALTLACGCYMTALWASTRLAGTSVLHAEQSTLTLASMHLQGAWPLL